MKKTRKQIKEVRKREVKILKGRVKGGEVGQ